MRDGKEIELHPPFCELCGTHMGEEYCFEDGIWENPNEYNEYGNNTCPNPKCRQEYEYEEGCMMVLTEEQLELLRKHKGL